MTTTAKYTPTNNDIFCRIAATVNCYNADKMTMDEALKIIVDVAMTRFKMPFYKSYWYSINPFARTIKPTPHKTYSAAIIPSEILENTYSAITGDEVQGFVDKGFTIEDVV